MESIVRFFLFFWVTGYFMVDIPYIFLPEKLQTFLWTIMLFANHVAGFFYTKSMIDIEKINTTKNLLKFCLITFFWFIHINWKDVLFKKNNL